jgi:hypothetical protein
LGLDRLSPAPCCDWQGKRNEGQLKTTISPPVVLFQQLLTDELQSSFSKDLAEKEKVS